ncbi:MAG: hypothetical protein ABH879_04375 [archaeon]
MPISPDGFLALIVEKARPFHDISEAYISYGYPHLIYTHDAATDRSYSCAAGERGVTGGAFLNIILTGSADLHPALSAEHPTRLYSAGVEYIWTPNRDSADQSATLSAAKPRGRVVYEGHEPPGVYADVRFDLEADQVLCVLHSPGKRAIDGIEKVKGMPLGHGMEELLKLIYTDASRP